MLKSRLSNDSRRFLDSRIPKHRRQILSKIVSLCQDPEPPDSKRLRDAEKGQRRVTVGEYRVIYWVIASPEPDTPGILYVGGIGKRNDDEVYRRFRKRGPRGN